MKSFLIDTNVLVRFFVADHAKHHDEAVSMFQEAEQGKKRLIVTPIVVAETCFVLESFYQHQRESIIEVFSVFLSQHWLKVEERGILKGLWPHYLKGFHFVDSYLMSRSRLDGSELLTFDKAIKKSIIK